MVKSELPFADLEDLFKSIQNKSYLLETPCCHFATSCFMLAKQSSNLFIDNHDTKALDPLVAFARFLTSGQQSIMSIDRWDDPTFTKLYLVAMEMAENDRVEALQTICQATQDQFEKITTTVSTTSAKGIDAQMQGDTIVRALKGSTTQ